MNKGRRIFLQTGAVAIPAAFILKNSTTTAEPNIGALVQQHNFLIEPGLFVRFDDKFEVVSATPWAIAQEDVDLLPFIRGEQQIDLTASSQNAPNGKKTSNLITLDRLSTFRLQGEIPVMDIAGDIGLARANNQAIDLKLNFYDKLTGQTRSTRPFYENSKGLPVAKQKISQAVGLNLAPMAVAAAIRIPISVPFTNYTLQFRGPDYDSMRNCAPEVNKHYHIEVMQKTIRGSKYIANFHIAIWRSGSKICFAIANSEGRPACFRKCSPSWTDIKNGVQQALVNVGISLAVAAAIAAVVATALSGSLVLLAV
jgi:hypothetical protein